MTDKDKAKELASLLVGEDQNPKPLIDVLLDMAKWKETQVKKSAKTQHVDKTCKEKGNSLTQESEAIDFEQELYKAFGQIKDFTGISYLNGEKPIETAEKVKVEAACKVPNCKFITLGEFSEFLGSKVR